MGWEGPKPLRKSISRLFGACQVNIVNPTSESMAAFTSLGLFVVKETNPVMSSFNFLGSAFR